MQYRRLYIYILGLFYLNHDLNHCKKVCILIFLIVFLIFVTKFMIIAFIFID